MVMYNYCELKFECFEVLKWKSIFFVTNYSLRKKLLILNSAFLIACLMLYKMFISLLIVANNKLERFVQFWIL